MIIKHLRATIGLLMGIALLVAACGAPQQGVVVRNVTNATAGAEHPTTVAQATGHATAAATTAPTQAGGAATQMATVAATKAPTQAAPTMAGMDMGTSAPVTRVAATQAAGAATAASTGDFVVGWLLYGTPTPKGNAPSGGAATKAATAAVTIAATTAVPATQAAAATTAAPTTAVAAAATATKPAGTAAATSVSGGAPAAGNPARGQQIFNGIGTCSSCHDVASGTTIVGPSQKGVATRDGTRKPGMSAHDYLYESIVKPNAFIVPGFQAGLMPQNFAQMLTPQQIEDVIAYLMTLK